MPIIPIDVFLPRDNGLPDLSKVSAAALFHGSIASHMDRVTGEYDISPYPKPDKTRMVDSQDRLLTMQALMDEADGPQAIDKALGISPSPNRQKQSGGPPLRTRTLTPLEPGELPSNNSGGGGGDNTLLPPYPGDNTPVANPPSLDTLPPEVLDALKTLHII